MFKNPKFQNFADTLQDFNERLLQNPVQGNYAIYSWIPDSVDIILLIFLIDLIICVSNSLFFFYCAIEKLLVLLRIFKKDREL